MPGQSKKADSGMDGGFQAIYPGVSQVKAFTNTSAQATALGKGTSLIRVFATQDCHLAFGTSPTAVATGANLFLPANTVEYIGVVPSTKVAVIRDTANGNLFITEGA